MAASRLLLVVAVMLGVGLATTCPQGCSCRHQRNLFSANCSSLPYNGGKVEALTLLPRDTPVELSDGQFNLAKHLKYLTLKNSSIYFVHKKAFYGAKKILEIDLSFNFIEELDPTVFQHLINLTRLSLRGNPIHLVSEMPFLISNSLSHLDIGQCQIKTIPRGIFYELKRLTYLSLDGNYLKTILYNSLPKGLKYLDLSSNYIVNVPIEEISTLTNVGRLGLAGNPINCSCSLMNFQDWLSGRGVIFEDDVICNTPLQYKGVSWSKVDENKLCLVEAKQEEMLSTDSLMKKKLYKESYKHKNDYFEENIQSDQPGLVPDSQVEVFMKNDDTIAMGEMMRDEEVEKEVNSTNKEPLVEEESDHKNPEVEKEEVESEKVSTEKEEVENVNLKTTDDEIADIEEDTPTTKYESSLKNSSELADLNLQENIVNKETIEENIVEDSEITDHNITSNSTDNLVDSTKVIESKENTKEDIESDVLNQPLSTPTDANPVEYKSLNEEDQEVDEFKKEGLYHVTGSKYRVEKNTSSEEPTIIPDSENTTEDEFSGQGPILDENTNEVHEGGEPDGNVTSSTETNNNTIVEEPVKSDKEEVVETVPPPVIRQNDFSSNENKQNTTYNEANTIEPVIIPHEGSDKDHINLESTESPGSNHIDAENEQSPDVTVSPIDNPKSEVESSVLTSNEKSQEMNEIEQLTKNDKIKEMAGAEVVMFCVAILVICLVLYSVYKCRSSKRRDSVRNIKDLESNRGTELQDMTSLLPKSPEEKKTNMKYNDDKALSSETVKLLTEQNENEPVNIIPNSDAKNKVEDKNALNNNTPNSPSKTPLINQEKPITISPASPIQRTKVKVGIIPDSIPRTPIFLQKTYNGTKKV